MLRTSRKGLLEKIRQAKKQGKKLDLSKLPWFVHANAVPGAKPLSQMVKEATTTGTYSEYEELYRDRMPDEFLGASPFDFDWQSIILNASGGVIGDGSPWGAQTLDSTYRGTQIAIIGAGAAGLAAGYELMKLGLQPVYFEMQTETSGSDTYARPMGRGYSVDYSCNELGNPPTFTNWFPTSVSGPSSNSDNTATQRQETEMGAMRYPPSHVALHTYVDQVFNNATAKTSDYYYGSGADVTEQWKTFRDPAEFSSGESVVQNPYGIPNDADTLLYPTVLYVTGVADDDNYTSSYRGYYRIDAGTELDDVNPAMNNLTFKYWEMMFGNDTSKGYLYDIVTDYINYATAANDSNEEDMAIYEASIKTRWAELNERFQGQSLYEVLEDNGWTTESSYPDGFSTNPAAPTMQEMFGAMGIGSGGFDVFFWTSFMETLRIELHLDETDQELFVGGTSYMLSPFLTHNATLYNSSTSNLWTKTKGYVITDPVVAISQRTDSDYGVRITTRDSSGTLSYFDFIACICTVSPSALRARIELDRKLLNSQAYSCWYRLRLTNSGKIFLNFPNDGTNDYSKAWWMHRTEDDPYDASNDDIVTTITNLNVRSIYTFDNYYWGTYNDSLLLNSGALMLSYAWDMNSDAFAALGDEDRIRTAWDQMKKIYQDSANTNNTLPNDVDSYLDWALDSKQYATIVWGNEDGFSGGYRMADPGENLMDSELYTLGKAGGQASLYLAGLTSYNWDADVQRYTGFFPAGESVAWLGLSGWIEGAIQSALGAVIGTVIYINKLGSKAPSPWTGSGKSFCLPMLPGSTQYSPTATSALKAVRETVSA
jgi:hypothetical protein